MCNCPEEHQIFALVALAGAFPKPSGFGRNAQDMAVAALTKMESDFTKPLSHMPGGRKLGGKQGVPLRAGVYNVRVRPGPDWCGVGFSRADIGGRGTVLCPGIEDLQEWADCYVESILMRLHVDEVSLLGDSLLLSGTTNLA